MRLRSLAAFSLVVTSAGSAYAQIEPAPAPTPTPPAEKPVAPAPTYAPPPPPPPMASEEHSEKSEKEPEKEHPSDFSRVIGRVGVGYFGGFDVPIGVSRTPGSIATQMIGIRTFFNERLGLDLGLGLGVSSGSNKVESGTTSTTTDQPSTLAFSFKVGVPIVVASAHHYAFFFEPQALIGYAGETVKPVIPPGGTNVPDTKHTGTRFTVGSSAGAIVWFGFIGLPSLALDATVGLALDVTNTKTEGPDPTTGGNTTASRKSSNVTLSTLSGNQPWNIFHSNVQVMYFF